MGRSNHLPSDPARPVKLRLVRLRMVDQCYDTGGAYWGGWSPSAGRMYRAVSTSPEIGTYAQVFIRALNRDAAKAKVRALVPGATFYR